MDILSPEARSERMRRIRSRDTVPEMRVRRLLHSLGYRYRLHVPGLPGKPDLVFSSRRKVVWIHGCLWHSHEGCRLNRPPKTRLDYWQPKLERNRARDAEHVATLSALGWDSLVIWECEAEGDVPALTQRLQDFLGPAISTEGKAKKEEE